MRHSSYIALFAIVLSTSPAHAAPPSARPAGDTSATPVVTVRLYDSAALPAATRAASLAVATSILNTAGLGIEWLACEMPAGIDINPCSRPVESAELIVHLTRAASDTLARRVELGHSLVDTAARAGSLATIYVDRAARFAREWRAHEDVVIGRVVAHELGHLLLGTGRHTDTGLMRAVWTPKANRPEVARDWSFTREDAAAMRDMVRLRVR
jgi:hypothetical protein